MGIESAALSKSDLTPVGDARAIYVAALKGADAGDLAPLLAFARS